MFELTLMEKIEKKFIAIYLIKEKIKKIKFQIEFIYMLKNLKKHEYIIYNAKQDGLLIENNKIRKLRKLNGKFKYDIIADFNNWKQLWFYLFKNKLLPSYEEVEQYSYLKEGNYEVV